jgi:hypothetical protein
VTQSDLRDCFPRRDTKTPSLYVPAFSCRGPKTRRPARISRRPPCYPSSCRSIRAGPRFNLCIRMDPDSGLRIRDGNQRTPYALATRLSAAGFANANTVAYRLRDLAAAIVPLRSACQGCYGSAQTQNSPLPFLPDNAHFAISGT